MALPPSSIVSIVYQAVLLLLGVPGNIIIILTYCKRKQRTSSGVFIIALALADLGVCLMSPVVIYHHVVYYDYPSDAFCKFRFYTNHGLIYVSRFLTIAVAIERYLAVCKPLSKRIQPKHAMVVSALCVPLGYLLTIPIAIAFRTIERPGGKTVCYPDTSDPAIKWVLKINFPITLIGGLLVVVFCYSRIYATIRKQLHVRAEMQLGPGQQLTPSSAQQLASSSLNATTTSSSAAQKTMQTSCVQVSVSGSGSNDDQNVTGESTTTSRDHESERKDMTSKLGAESEDLSRCVTGDGENKDPVKREKRVSFLKRSRKKTSKPKSKSNSMDSTTKMLLIVTVIYFVSFLPQLVTLMIPAKALRDFRINHKIGYEVFSFVRSLITVNHVMNPFVYGFVNRRFRQDCLAALKEVRDKVCIFC